MKKSRRQPQAPAGVEEAQRIAQESEEGLKVLSGLQRRLIPIVAAAWSLYQLALASVLIMNTVYIRAIHLAFAMALVFLSRPFFKKAKKSRFASYFARQDRITLLDFLSAAVAVVASLYIVIDYVSASPGVWARPSCGT